MYIKNFVFQGLDESDQKAVDDFLLKLDGTENKCMSVITISLSCFILVNW